MSIMKAESSYKCNQCYHQIGIVMLGSRDASILRDALAGVSMVEIGDRVNMSEHTIRNMVSAMKSDLKEQLAFEYENNKWEV